MRGTRRLAGQPPSTGLPITPPIVPIGPIGPIVPIGPAPASPGSTPSPIVPPVAPGEMRVAVTRMRRLALCFGCLGDRLADSCEPFRDTGLARRRRLQSGRMICATARHRCTEQERHPSHSSRDDRGQDPTVFLPQRQQISLHDYPSSPMLL